MLDTGPGSLCNRIESLLMFFDHGGLRDMKHTVRITAESRSRELNQLDGAKARSFSALSLPTLHLPMLSLQIPATCIHQLRPRDRHLAT